MKKEKDLSVAVLIDGDNASSEKMEDVMRFVSRYGAAVVRRIYGDWTKKSLSGWKFTINCIEITSGKKCERYRVT